MPNRTTFFIIGFITAVLILAQLRVAIHHQLWLEFFISSFQVLLCAGSSLYLLRSR